MEQSATQSKLDTVRPVGDRVLIKWEAHKSQTSAGIHLPETMKIPTLIGRIMAISPKVAINSEYSDLKQYQRVLFIPNRNVPVDFEKLTNLIVIPVEDIVAIIGPDE